MIAAADGAKQNIYVKVIVYIYMESSAYTTCMILLAAVRARYMEVRAH